MVPILGVNCFVLILQNLNALVTKAEAKVEAKKEEAPAAPKAPPAPVVVWVGVGACVGARAVRASVFA
jgi:hypothetical protein